MIIRLLNVLHRRYGQGFAHPYEGLPLLLVAGVGRSGTTVLRHSIGAHPLTHTTGAENNMLYDVLQTGYHNCTYPSRRATLQVSLPVYERAFRLLILNLLWPEARSGSQRPRALVACSGLTPERAEFFCRLFPAGRIIYIVRNGIAVIASRMNFPQFRDDPFASHCAEWLKPLAMDEWGQNRPAYIRVRHEELIKPETAEAALRRTLSRADMPYDPVCLQQVLGTRFHPTVAGNEAEGKRGDLGSRQERWRFWTPEQQEHFVRICGPAMAHFGYPLPWPGDAASGPNSDDTFRPIG